MLRNAGGVISTTRKLPRKSAAAAREEPFARILRGRISGGQIQTVAIQPMTILSLRKAGRGEDSGNEEEMEEHTPCKASLESKYEDNGSDT